jgi:hypothetical protein
MHAQARLRDRTIEADSRPDADGPKREVPHLRALPSAPADWTSLPEAAAILADCAARPPARRMVRIEDLGIRHELLYVGPRVGRLKAIHRAEARRILVLCDVARDYAAFDAHARRSVQNAIADAVLHGALARSAACDARALEAVA